MSETNGKTLTRREVLAGGALALAGVALTSNADAQAEQPNTKQVPVYVTEAELVEWTQEFVQRIKVGVPLIQAFNEVGELTENKYLRQFTENLIAILKMGYTLSGIMTLSPHIFDGHYITTVRYGENYGILDQALEMWLKHRPKPEVRG